MSTARSRTGAALAASALMLAALTACGDTETPTAETTRSAETAATDAETDAEKTAFVDSLLDALQSQESARAELTFGTSVTAEAVFAYGAEPRTDISVKIVGQSLRLIAVQEKVYLQRSAGAKYVVLTKDDPSLAALGGGLADLDPQQALAGIADAITEVREVGPATIDGAELTRYTVRLDGQEIGEGMLSMVPGVDLSEELVLDLYVDADDLVHLLEADLGGNELVLKVTDWGSPVTITAPGAAEILSN